MLDLPGFLRRSRFLNDRDLFGECCAAAKQRGLRVIARYSPDLVWSEALGYDLLSAFIKTGSRLAIWLSERI